MSDKQTVEGITMMHGQARSECAVLSPDRELIESAVDRRRRYLRGIGGEVPAPHLRLDRDLPDARCRKQDFVRGIEYRLACLAR